MNNKFKFTDLSIKNLSPTLGRRIDYSDLDCPGLVLRLTEKGIKTFSYSFRLGGRTGRSTIGKYPQITIRDARQKTAEMKALVAKGIDPREMKQSAVIDNMKLTKHMINEFIEIYAKPRNSSWKQAQYNLNRYVVPFIGRKPIAEIKRADLHIILDKLSEQGKNITCNRTLAHMKRFFGWIVERGYLEYSPADHIKPRHIERRRERVLSDDEIKLIWASSENLNPSYQAWIKLLFLCGQRETETAQIRTSQIKDNIWELASTDTKNKRPSLVPLSSQSQSIINNIKNPKNNYLLTSGVIGDRPINGFSKTKNRIDQMSSVKEWTWHDIRAAVATNLAKLGYDRLLIKRVLNHKDSSVTAIYDRYTYINEVRDALQNWADKLDAITR